MKYLLIAAAVAILGLAGGFYYYISNHNQPSYTQPVAPPGTNLPPTTTTPSTPPATSTAQTPSDPNVKTFTSADLGISFNYLASQSDGQFSAKQIGSKIYVYQPKFPMEQGQYVEVFTKAPADDLKTAIEKKFLTNYSKTDCFAKISNNPVAKQITPDSFVFAIISYPPPADDTMPAWAGADKCPSPYTASNGIAYFVTDTAHPDKFVFFSIGQYPINGGPNNLLWQSTLKFL